MSAPLGNVSFDGSPVRLRLDSPVLVCLDPLFLDCVRTQLAALPADARTDVGIVLTRVNANQTLMSCYEIANFRPGMYMLDPRDIRKFGDEDEDFDYNEAEYPEGEPVDAAASYPFVSVDSAALVIADFAHLSELVRLLNWEQFDLALQDDAVFGRITIALGGPCFAVVMGGCLPDMEFDGDGIYTIKAGSVRPCGVEGSPQE